MKLHESDIKSFNTGSKLTASIVRIKVEVKSKYKLEQNFIILQSLNVSNSYRIKTSNFKKRMFLVCSNGHSGFSFFTIGIIEKIVKKAIS